MHCAGELLREPLLDLQPMAARVEQRLERAGHQLRCGGRRDKQHARLAEERQHVVLALRGEAQAGHLRAPAL
jgi:hypothetical protein